MDDNLPYFQKISPKSKNAAEILGPERSKIPILRPKKAEGGNSRLDFRFFKQL